MSFWEYSDYRDPVLNSSFGLAHYQFDSYAWNNRLAFEFQEYVEKYYPVAEHSHLTYFEYCNLLRYFYYSYAGYRTRPLLGATDRIRPEYGVQIPTKTAMAPMQLYKKWLKNFQRTLALNRALVLKCGTGLVSMVTRDAGVRMVQSVDSDPRAIVSAKRDAISNRFMDLSFKVSSFFPETSEEEDEMRRNKGEQVKKKYDMIVFAPDFNFLQLSQAASHGVDDYAPSMTGYRGDLEQFFEEANDHLTERGVIVILTSNFLQLAYPKETHPIELEIKANRRWILLDYFDEKINFQHQSMDVNRLGTRMHLFRDLAKEMRSELWVLHRVESLYNFGWIHGIPGCVKPGAAGNVGFGTGGINSQRFAERRVRMMQDKLESEGRDWGEYKDRMMKSMAAAGSGGGGDELPDDDFSKSMKMALDPTYASKLAEQSKKIILAKLEEQKKYRRKIVKDFNSDDFSPRDAYDQEQKAAVEKFEGIRREKKKSLEEQHQRVREQKKKLKEKEQQQEEDEEEETSL